MVLAGVGLMATVETVGWCTWGWRKWGPKSEEVVTEE